MVGVTYHLRQIVCTGTSYVDLKLSQVFTVNVVSYGHDLKYWR